MDIVDVENKLKRYIAEEWRLKGHPLNGAFEKSLEAKTSKIQGGIKIDILGNEYGIYVSKGVSSDKIPYSRGSKRGGTSKYIQGLKSYVQMRMGISDEREALGIAFAIAEKHKKEGMKGSGFLQIVSDKYLLEIEGLVTQYFLEQFKKAL
jgi:hypothetical protein